MRGVLLAPQAQLRFRQLPLAIELGQGQPALELAIHGVGSVVTEQGLLPRQGAQNAALVEQLQFRGQQ